MTSVRRHGADLEDHRRARTDGTRESPVLEHDEDPPGGWRLDRVKTKRTAPGVPWPTRKGLEPAAGAFRNMSRARTCHQLSLRCEAHANAEVSRAVRAGKRHPALFRNSLMAIALAAPSPTAVATCLIPRCR